MKTIQISYEENTHAIAEEYAHISDDGSVELRRKVTSKLEVLPGRSTNVTDMPQNSLTIAKIKKLAAAL